MDEEDRLSEVCNDLVSLARFEPGLVHLFQRAAGAWVPVAELLRAAGASDETLPPTLAATWLVPPSGQPGYAVVFFCDDELQWSTTAYYNAERLVGAGVR